MKHLIDKEKFLEEYEQESSGYRLAVKKEQILYLFDKHTKDLVEEPQYPSGMDHDKIKIRNDLRKELRGE